MRLGRCIRNIVFLEQELFCSSEPECQRWTPGCPSHVFPSFCLFMPWRICPAVPIGLKPTQNLPFSSQHLPPYLWILLLVSTQSCLCIALIIYLNFLPQNSSLSNIQLLIYTFALYLELCSYCASAWNVLANQTSTSLKTPVWRQFFQKHFLSSRCVNFLPLFFWIFFWTVNFCL